MIIEEPPASKMSLQRLVKSCKKGQFGNLLGYYKRQNQEPWNDPRIGQIHPQYINNRSVLYIGCHDGTIPIQLAMRFQPESIEAIDIDPKLLLKAVEKCRMVDTALETAFEKNHPYINEFAIFRDDDLIGLLIRMREAKGSSQLLNTIRFKLKNVLDLDESYRSRRFATVFCLKLTKYVHLNFGDQGLKVLFKNLYELLEVGGVLIFQPHTRKSYNKFKSFAPICAENYKAMEIQPEHFETFLTTNYRFRLHYKCELENFGKQAKEVDEEAKVIYFFQKVG